MDGCNLIDLGFIGVKFIWKKGRVRERLNRALTTCDWRVKFDDVVVHHLSRTKSDHYLILVNFASAVYNGIARLFWFQAVRLTHRAFKKFM